MHRQHTAKVETGIQHNFRTPRQIKLVDEAIEFGFD